jgi:hypothetical protein
MENYYEKLLEPHFEKLDPIELKIYLTIYWLANSESNELKISAFRLSKKVNIQTNDLISFLEKLKNRG